MAAGLLLALVASCQLPKVCTEIGCDDQLRIQLLGSIPDSVRVSAQEPGGASRVVDCTPTRCLDGMVTLSGFLPESVTIEVHGQGVDVTRTVRPEYQWFYPNGTSCPGKCRQATVEIQVR